MERKEISSTGSVISSDFLVNAASYVRVLDYKFTQNPVKYN